MNAEGNEPEPHLERIESQRFPVDGFERHLLTRGAAAGIPVIFLHGNGTSSTIWKEVMSSLPESYRCIAPDLRGYGASPLELTIDATRGIGDWVDDVRALCDALRLDRMHLVGHSLGGCVAWGCVARFAERIRSVTLFAPGPPCGFGGVHGTEGTLNHADGAGSGAGLVAPRFVEHLKAGDRGVDDPLFSPRVVMNRTFWRAGFVPEREEALLTALLQMHLGPRAYPGDSVASPHWPGFAPGRFGPANALSPLHNRSLRSDLVNASPKPPILWIHGAEDSVVSDRSVLDAGCLGQRGLLPGWPGPEVFPVQPMIQQIQSALDDYRAAGGVVRSEWLPGIGHSPFLEAHERCSRELLKHLERTEQDQGR